MFEHVFAPIKIREMELKNRIILPAMGTRMADADGFVTEKLVASGAAGNAGTICDIGDGCFDKWIH